MNTSEITTNANARLLAELIKELIEILKTKTHFALTVNPFCLSIPWFKVLFICAKKVPIIMIELKIGTKLINLAYLYKHLFSCFFRLYLQLGIGFKARCIKKIRKYYKNLRAGRTIDPNFWHSKDMLRLIKLVCGGNNQPNGNTIWLDDSGVMYYCHLIRLFYR
jgi:hypothetical protein